MHQHQAEANGMVMGTDAVEQHVVFSWVLEHFLPSFW